MAGHEEPAKAAISRVGAMDGLGQSKAGEVCALQLPAENLVSDSSLGLLVQRIFRAGICPSL